jgi:hypothetical protein
VREMRLPKFSPEPRRILHSSWSGRSRPGRKPLWEPSQTRYYAGVLIAFAEISNDFNRRVSRGKQQTFQAYSRQSAGLNPPRAHRSRSPVCEANAITTELLVPKSGI